MNRRHNLGTTKFSAKNISYTCNKELCHLCMDDCLQKSIKNWHVYEKNLRRKFQGLGDILSLEEVRVEFNKDH